MCRGSVGRICIRSLGHSLTSSVGRALSKWTCQVLLEVDFSVWLSCLAHNSTSKWAVLCVFRPAGACSSFFVLISLIWGSPYLLFDTLFCKLPFPASWLCLFSIFSQWGLSFPTESCCVCRPTSTLLASLTHSRRFTCSSRESHSQGTGTLGRLCPSQPLLKSASFPGNFPSYAKPHGKGEKKTRSGVLLPWR